jgi:hypothetical protein
MCSAEDRKKQLQLSNAFIAGERILNVKFRHNSHVSFIDEDGEKAEGSIVSVGPIEPEPVYTVERSDGNGDEEVKESLIKLLYDPHEK